MPVIIITVILQLFLSIVICTSLVFYSPFFTTLKKFAVASAMESRTQQYIAKLFLSESEINALIGEPSTEPAISQNYTNVVNQNMGDTNIDEYEVNGSQFHGYVLEIKTPSALRLP